MDITINVELGPKTLGFLTGLLQGDYAGDKPADLPKSQEEKAEKLTSEQMPKTFTSDKAKRKWLTDRLTEMGIDIPPRTRTATLVKTYEDALSEGTIDEETEEMDDSDVIDGDDDMGFMEEEEEAFEPTADDVNEALKKFMAGAKTEKEKKARKAKIMKEFKECDGAKSVKSLDPSYFEHFMHTFGG